MEKHHAVVFPIPLQGHINPMMMLAKHLNSSGIRVTFLLTHRTLSILHKNNSSKHNIGAASHKDEHINRNCNNNCQAEGDIQIIADNNKLNQLNAFGIRGDDNHNHGINKGNESRPACGAVDNHNIQNDSKTLQQEDEDGSANTHTLHNVPPIEFETLPDSASPHDQSLPMSASVLLFLDSIPLLERKLEEILEALQQKGNPATCIISDSFVPWTQDVANKFGIPRIEFWCSSVTVYSMGYHIPHLINGGYLPVQPGTDRQFCVDVIPGLAPFRLIDFFYTHAISSPVFDVVSKAFSRAKEAHRVLINSFYDLEKDIIDALRTEGVSIEPIGPLFPLESRHHAIQMQRGEENVEVKSTSLYADDEDCLAWLDRQAEGSVIYVSFGSMVNISKEEMQELILGLEGSQQPYLLVIRSDIVSEASTVIGGGGGRICAWAPQIPVLGHPAVGGFLTHCGWNSIMEAMCMGVPMIGCPRESEQHTNMKCLRDEWKVAIGFEERHGQYCEGGLCHCEESPTNRVKIKKELVERAVRDLMQEEIGAVLRRRIQGLQRAALHAAHTLAPTALLQSLFKNNPS